MTELPPPPSKKTVALDGGITVLITPAAYLVYDQNGVTTTFNRSQDPEGWLSEDVNTLTTCMAAEEGHQQRRQALLEFLEQTLAAETEGE